MRDIEEIKANPRILVQFEDSDGFKGTIAMPTWRGSVICSFTGGWEHVSVSPGNRRILPTWDDMSLLKDIFWKDDEAVIQVHPAKALSVNNLSNCLHLWRCYFKEMVLPPTFMVGLRDGQTYSDLEKEAKAYFEMVGEKY